MASQKVRASLLRQVLELIVHFFASSGYSRSRWKTNLGSIYFYLVKTIVELSDVEIVRWGKHSLLLRQGITSARRRLFLNLRLRFGGRLHSGTLGNRGKLLLVRGTENETCLHDFDL